MCLVVNKAVRNNHHKENGYCVAYKVIRLNNSTLFSQINKFLYKVGENTPSEPSYNFNKKYYYEDRVDYGLHLFLDKSIAKKLILYNEMTVQNHPENMKMIKVYYKPEDVIAYGKSNTITFGFDIEKSVVVRKLTIKSLDPIK